MGKRRECQNTRSLLCGKVFHPLFCTVSGRGDANGKENSPLLFYLQYSEIHPIAPAKHFISFLKPCYPSPFIKFVRNKLFNECYNENDVSGCVHSAISRITHPFPLAGDGRGLWLVYCWDGGDFRKLLESVSSKWRSEGE